MKDALALRAAIKKRKPNFVRQDSHKKAEVRNKAKWRKPKGHQSKMRLNVKGYRRCVSQGYRSPSEVRGLSAEGKEIVIVQNVSDLTAIDSAKQVACISARVGMKKKKILLQKAKEKNITIINIKSIDQALKEIEDMLSKKKKQKEEAAKTKKEKEKERKAKEKEAKKKDELTEKIEEEEKAKIEKAEKDKILTKKE
jgi:large subunit ribosomal protein L32e